MSYDFGMPEPLGSSQYWQCTDCKLHLFYYPYNGKYEWSPDSMHWSYGIPPDSCIEVKDMNKMNESLE